MGIRFPHLLALAAMAAGFAVGGFEVSGETVPAATPTDLVLGSISMSPGTETKLYQPLVDHLASRIDGAERGRVRVVESIREMATLLERGEVDLYIDSPFPVALASHLSGARPFLRRLKYGAAEYRSVIFVRHDRGIQTLDDLHGQMLAFQEPYSTSGYLLPKASLLASGHVLQAHVDTADHVRPNHIGYVLSGDGETTLLWVLKGKVAAGALNESYFQRLAGIRRDELRVLHSTPQVPRNVVCHRADLPAERLSQIESALIQLHWTDAGRRLLADLEETDRFERFPRGPDEAMSEVDALLKLVLEEVDS